MTDAQISCRPTQFLTEDGVELKGQIIAPDDPQAVMAIHAATGYLGRFYEAFAQAAADEGWAVLIYDYRGQGQSRQYALREDPSTMIEWGRYDMVAASRHICKTYPGRPYDYIGHSVGGHYAALTPSDVPIRRVALISAGSGFWPYHSWYMVLPALYLWCVGGPISLFFSGGLSKGGGWAGDDLPKGVFKDWRHFCTRADAFLPRLHELGLLSSIETFSAPVRGFCALDDPLANPKAMRWLLDVMSGVEDKKLVCVSPAHIGHRRIGHDGLFRAKLSGAYWPTIFKWLETGTEG